MNVKDFIDRGGYVTVKNPDYNPRAKKNKQPKYIQQLDLSGREDNIFSTPLAENIDERYSVPSEVVDKYAEYGITYNRISDMNAELVDAQSTLEKAKNALVQTVVSEIGIGTMRGFSDLADFVLSKGLGVVDDDYTNPVSATLQQWQEEFKKNNPIYYDQSLNIFNGGLLSAGWWLSNLPSIASSLTLMIPGAGLMKGLSYLGKATRFTKGVSNARRFLTNINKIDKAVDEGRKIGALGKASQWVNSTKGVKGTNNLINYGITGFTSRVLENYQEANQVYNDLLPEMTSTIAEMDDDQYAALLERSKNELEGIDPKDRAAVAKRLAKAGADETFRDDMWNGVFDVYQLYALRNIGRIMNAPMRASIRRAHLNSMKYPGKSAGEIEELLAKRGILEKTKDKVSDWVYGSSTALASQLSEGVEEAINYISQKEGMHYGHVLLGTDKVSDFDDRLSEYLKAPELYDSAFWGVMGGVGFHYIGSKLARLSNAIETKYNERKYDEKSKEETKKTPWNQAFADPEIQRRKGNIEARSTAYTTLIGELDKIKNQHINPWDTNADGTNKVLETQEERDVATNLAYDTFAETLLMDSMFVGNWDLTKAFLESDEIRDAFVEAGVMSQEEANQRQTEVKNLASKMETLYEQNMRAIGNAMRGVDETTGARYEDMPVEYMQIIAEKNMKYQLEADRCARNIESYNPIISSEEERVKDLLNKQGIDYKQSIRLFILSKELGEIESELEQVSKTIKEGRPDGKKDIDPRTISGQTAIRNLKQRKEVLLNMLHGDISPTENIDDKKALKRKTGANLLTTLRAVAATEKDARGGYKMNMASKRYKDLDATITKALNATPETWGEILPELTAIDEHFAGYTLDEFKEVEHQAKVVNETIGSALGSTGTISNLSEISENLLNAYAQITHNEIARQTNLSNIAKTRKSILTAAHDTHNNMVSLRAYALSMAIDNLKKIAKDHYEEHNNIDNLLAYGTINDSARKQLKEILSDKEMATYDDTMRIIALNDKRVTGNRKVKDTSIMNSMLPEIIQDILYESSRDEFVDVENEEESEETPKTKEELKEEVDKSEPIKSSSKGKKAAKEPKGGEKLDFMHNKAGKKLVVPTANLYVNDDGAPVNVGIMDSSDDNAYTTITIKPVEGEENIYELDYLFELEEDYKDDSNESFTNSNLFVINHPILNGGKVVKNPIIAINDSGYIVELRPGVIDNVKPESEEEEGNEGEVPSTGGEESDSTTYTEGDEEDGGGIPVVELNISQEEFETILDSMEEDALKYLASSIKNNTTYDEKELFKLIREKYKDKNLDDNVLEELWNRVKPFYSNAARERGLNVEELTNLAEFLEASAIADEDISSSAAKHKLDNAFDKVLEDYLNRTVREEFNGRKVISLTNFLRYIREISDSPLLARALYDRFYNILSNDRNYYLREGTKVNKNTVLSNANRDATEVFQDKLNTSFNGRNIGISYFTNLLPEDERQKAYDAIDNAKPGDKLTVTVNEYGTGVTFGLNGTNIGFAAVPRNFGDRYVAVNKDWIYDIPKSKDGSVSEIKSLFIKLLANPDNTPEGEKVIKLLQSRRYITKSVRNVDPDVKEKYVPTPQYIKWVDDLWNAVLDVDPDAITLTNLINEPRNRGNRSDTVIKRNLMDHLYNVYDGTKTASDNYLSKKKIDRDVYEATIHDLRIKSINDWFDKVEEGYLALNYLVNNTVNVEVDTVYEGGLNIVDPSQAKPVNEDGVIADKYKDSIEVVVASISEPGIMYSTDTNNPTVDNPYVSGGSTFVSIPRSNGELALVHAYPRPLSDFTGEDKKNTIGGIKQDIVNEIERLVKEWSNDARLTTDDLASFLNILCCDTGVYKNNTPLCKGIKVEKITGNIPGIRLVLKVNGRTSYIHLFDEGKYGKLSAVDFGTAATFGVENTNKVNLTTKGGRNKDAAVTTLINFIQDALEFNIGFGHVQNDTTTVGYGNINSKGEFVVEIPNGKQHVFKSYKDFIINNGVVKVTTQVKNNSNFAKRDSNTKSFDVPRITFKIVTETSSPVEESTSPQPTSTDRATSIKDTVENSNGRDIADTIISALLDNTQIGVLKNSKLFKAIPLNNIVYVSKISEKQTDAKGNPVTVDVIAAHVNTDVVIDGKTIPANSIVITDNWLNKVNEDPEQAFRHLLHEAIHRHIYSFSEKERTEFFDSIRGIYEEFVEANEKDGVRDVWKRFEYANTKQDANKYYSDGQINDKGLEEFLIESITRPALISRLNEIDDKDYKGPRTKIGNTKSKNLFQKILAVVAKLFGLNISKGSLLAKEYKLFEDIIKNPTTTTENTNITTKEDNKSKPKKTEEVPTVSEPKENLDKNIETSRKSVETLRIEDVNDSDELNWEDIDESRYSDEDLASISQVRERLEPENGKVFERLTNLGAIDIRC